MPCHAHAVASGLRCSASRALSARRTSTSCAQRSDRAGPGGHNPEWQPPPLPPPPPPALPAHGYPGGSSTARCRCQPRPRYLPAPRPCSGRGRHPEPEPTEGPAATGSAGQPHRFREASVPALPGGLVRTRRPWSRCQTPFPGRCRPQRSRHDPAGQTPHEEQRRRLWPRVGGKEKRSGKRPISARLVAGGVAQWAGALLRCGAGGGWRWRRRRRAG